MLSEDEIVSRIFVVCFVLRRSDAERDSICTRYPWRPQPGHGCRTLRRRCRNTGRISRGNREFHLVPFCPIRDKGVGRTQYDWSALGPVHQPAVPSEPR